MMTIYKRYISTRETHIVGLPREVIAQYNDGTTFPVELFITARQHGDHWVFIGIMHDISKRKTMEAALKIPATTDGLTRIHNRAYFNEKLNAEFKRATIDIYPYSCWMPIISNRSIITMATVSAIPC